MAFAVFSVDQQRPEWVQFEQWGKDMDYPKKLNVGCGYDIRPGYLNVDNEGHHKPDLVADITNLSMLPSNYFEEIVAQDVLEHISRTIQVPVLVQWAGLLVSDGTLRVRVPSLTDMVSLAHRPEWQDEDKQLYLVQMVYGTQAYAGDYHRCGYTPWTVTAIARDAGLFVSDVSLKDEWLYDITFKKLSDRTRITDREVIVNAYFSGAHRLPDTSGLEYWASRLAAGDERDHVRASIVAISTGSSSNSPQVSVRRHV